MRLIYISRDLLSRKTALFCAPSGFRGMCGTFFFSNSISSSIRYKSVITLSSKHDYVAFTHAHATDTLFEARNTQTDRVEKGEINEKQKRSTKNVVSHISSPEAYPSSSSTCSKSWSKLSISRYPSGTSAWPSSPPRATIAHPTPPPRPITRTT